MANPSVTATISAHDEATAVMMQFARNAKQVGKDIEKAFGTTGTEVNRHMREMAQASARQANELRSSANVMAGALTAIAGAAGMALGKMKQIAAEITELSGRMIAYGGASRDVVNQMRDIARVQGVGGPGGQKGMMQAGYAALKANVNPDAAKLIAPLGQQYARMQGVEPEEGMERLLQLSAMMGDFKDEKGREVTPDQLSPERVDQILKTRLGKLISFERKMPGKSSDIFEAYKYVGPQAADLNVDEATMQAFLIDAAQKGITGAHAGTLLRGVLARTMPTAKGLAAQRSLGLDAMKYATFNEDLVTGKSVSDGLAARFGELDKATRKGIAHAVDAYKKSGNKTRLVDDLSAATAHSGIKSLEDREKARKAALEQLGTYITNYDVKQELIDAKKAGAGAKFFQNRFQLESGVVASAISRFAETLSGQIDKYRAELNSTDHARVAEKAEADYQSTFGAQSARLGENFKAFLDGLFQPWERFISPLVGKANSLMEAFNGASEGVRRFGSVAVEVAASLALVGSAAKLKALAEPASGAVGGALGGAVAGAGGRAAVGGFVGTVAGGAAALGTAGLMLAPIIGANALVMNSQPRDVFDLGDETRERLEEAHRRANAGRYLQFGPEGVDDPAIAAKREEWYPVWDMKPQVGAPWPEDVRPSYDKRGRYSFPHDSDFGAKLDKLSAQLNERYQVSIPAPQVTSPTGNPVADQLRGGSGQVVVQGEGRLDAEVNVHVNPSPEFMASIDKKIQQSSMSLRDKTGTSLSGSNGVRPAAPAMPSVAAPAAAKQ